MSGPLTERQEKLLGVFKMAIENERAAQDLYKEASELCDDASLRVIIEGFVLEERRHEQALMRKYNELRGTTEYKNPEETEG